MRTPELLRDLAAGQDSAASWRPFCPHPRNRDLMRHFSRIGAFRHPSALTCRKTRTALVTAIHSQRGRREASRADKYLFRTWCRCAAHVIARQGMGPHGLPTAAGRRRRRSDLMARRRPPRRCRPARQTVSCRGLAGAGRPGCSRSASPGGRCWPGSRCGGPR